MILSLNENILREEIKETEHRLEETRIRKNERLAQLNILEKGSGGGRLAEKEASYKTLLRTYTDQHPELGVTHVLPQVLCFLLIRDALGQGYWQLLFYCCVQAGIAVAIQVALLRWGGKNPLFATAQGRAA